MILDFLQTGRTLLSLVNVRTESRKTPNTKDCYNRVKVNTAMFPISLRNVFKTAVFVSTAQFPLPELTGDQFPLPVNMGRMDG